MWQSGIDRYFYLNINQQNTYNMEEIRTFTINGKEIKAIVLDKIEDWKNDMVFIIYHDNSIKRCIEHRGEIKKCITLMIGCYNPKYNKQLQDDTFL